MMMIGEHLYQTVTGRTIDLKNWKPQERDCLFGVLKKYETKLGWSEFSAWWQNHVEHYRFTSDSPVYRICDDLEARLGIAQGKVGAPTYRDYLAALIEERYGSRYKFCQETGIDQGQLSKVISGKTDFSMDLLHKVLTDLHATLVFQKDETVKDSASPEEATRVLAAMTR